MTDQEIVNAIREGGASENDAMCFLLKKFQRMVVSLVTRNGGTFDDASDILQEGLLAFLLSARHGKYNPNQSSISNYLNTIFWNKTVDNIRRNQKMDRLDSQLILIPVPRIDAVKKAMVSESDTALIGSLINESWGQFCLRLWEAKEIDEMDNQAIADKFKIGSANAVTQHRLNCLRELFQAFVEKAQSDEGVHSLLLKLIHQDLYARHIHDLETQIFRAWQIVRKHSYKKLITEVADSYPPRIAALIKYLCEKGKKRVSWSLGSTPELRPLFDSNDSSWDNFENISSTFSEVITGTIREIQTSPEKSSLEPFLISMKAIDATKFGRKINDYISSND